MKVVDECVTHQRGREIEVISEPNRRTAIANLGRIRSDWDAEKAGAPVPIKYMGSIVLGT